MKQLVYNEHIIPFDLRIAKGALNIIHCWCTWFCILNTDGISENTILMFIQNYCLFQIPNS